MKYIECPQVVRGNEPSVFLAGGITGTSPWQTDLVKTLQDTPWTVLNPRRKDFPMYDPVAGREQIAWEHQHIRLASLLSFWFPPETLCPITLYELGVATELDKPLVVGADPGYARRFDLEVQLGLTRPEVKVLDSIKKLAHAIATHRLVKHPT